MADLLADQQAQSSIKLLWDTEPTLGGFFGQLRAGKLKSPMVTPGSGPGPYARVHTNQGTHQYNAASTPDPNFGFSMSGTPYIDVREVHVEAWGKRADIVQLGANIAFLSWLPKTVNGVVKTLLFPPPAVFMVLRPVGQPKMSEEAETKEGTDVWKLLADYELLTTRQNP